MYFSRHTTVRPSSTTEVPELDVTPIMNLLIILIPFLVSMTVFTHLAVLRFSLPSNVGSGISTNDQKPKLKLTVVIAEEYCAITHGEIMLDSIAIIKGAINSGHFIDLLKQHRASVDETNEVVIAVRNSVPFEQVVRVMDSCKSAGFIKIGLSNATENPHTGV